MNSVSTNKVETGWDWGIYRGVSPLKAIVSVLCLGIWLPATQHCRLENLPGLEFLQCATDTPGKSDCQGDSCDTVEHGAYRVPDNGDLLVFPVLAAAMPEPMPAVADETALVVSHSLPLPLLEP